jgi:predicted amidohydrolase
LFISWKSVGEIVGMTTYSQFRLAAIQAAPVYFDREASTEKACELIQKAGAKRATLAAFSECWLPGYPFHVWGERATVEAVAPEYLANAVDIPSLTTEKLCDAVRRANIDVVIGMAERDARSRGTVYCTLLFIGNDGKILGRHRKLKPTHRERTAWGEGDGSSLVVYERPYGRISGLNCWEHNMVLPGYTLMDQGTQIHIAAWPGMDTSRHLLLSRAFASQAAAYVIDVGALLSPEHVTGVAKKLVEEQSGEVVEKVTEGYPGESSIIDPQGEIITGPAEGERILIADCSEEQIFAAKARCDVAGHYSRPDLFQLCVNRTPHRSVIEIKEQKHEIIESETDDLPLEKRSSPRLNNV